MKTTLFEIESQYLQLVQQLMEAEGELSPELEEDLAINREMLEHKASNYLQVIKELDGKLHAASEEIKRLQSVKQSINTVKDRLKGSLLNALMLYGTEDKKGVKRLEIGLNKLSTRKSTSVIVTDDALIPDTYAKWTKIVNKTDLKKGLQNGAKIEGAEIVENVNLSIR